jgi:hypothetical protein
MEKRKKKKRWVTCPACHQMIFAEQNSLGGHRCAPEIQAKKDAELDAVIGETLTTWAKDIDKFWNANDVRFTDYLLRKDKY